MNVYVLTDAERDRYRALLDSVTEAANAYVADNSDLAAIGRSWDAVEGLRRFELELCDRLGAEVGFIRDREAGEIEYVYSPNIAAATS